MIRLCAPDPTEMMIITAATPMIMPNIVKNDRPLLVVIPVQANLMMFANSIANFEHRIKHDRLE